MLLRRQVTAVAVVALAFASLVLAQADTPQISTALATGVVYTPGRWVPLRVTVRNPTDAVIAGNVVMSMTTEAGPYELQRGIHVPANSRVISDMLATFPIPPSINVNAKQERKPIAGILLHGTQGGVVAREELYGNADTESLHDTPAGDLPGVIALNVYDEEITSDLFEPMELKSVLTEAAGYPVTPAAVQPSGVMRRGVSFDAVRLVMIDARSLETLDTAQREAILQNVRSGATLLVISRDASVASTWAGPLLPLDVVGTREAGEIATDAFGKLRFTRPAPVLETIARPGATVVATASFGPVAAYRSVGFGRVAMLTIPINAIAHAEAQLPRLWASMVGFSESTFHDPHQIASTTAPPVDAPKSVGENARAPVDRSIYGVLRAMVGETAPPWRTAAIIAGIYTAGVAGVMLLVGAQRRPVALLACVGGGVLLAGGVLGLSGLRTGSQPLLVARFSTVDLNDGAARRNEYVAFFGQQRDADIAFTLPELATPRALVAAGTTAPQVTMFPFTVDRVSASTGKLASVWQVRSFDTSAPRLDATLTFDDTGAKLSLDSALETPLEAPRLAYGARVFPLETMNSGASSSAVGAVNPVGDWSAGGGIIADEQSKLRLDILHRVEAPVLTPSATRAVRKPELRLMGFSTADGSAIALKEDVTRKTQSLIRTPVRISPTPVGQNVTIGAGFTQVRRDAALSLPYSEVSGEWNESTQTGPWLLAIAAPQGVGKIDAKTLELAIDVRSVGHQITLRRGQLRNGKVRENPAGEVVLQTSASGARQATVDLTPADVDANGWVWLLLDVKPPEMSESMLGMSDTSQTTWRILSFNATLRGVVAAPPGPEVTTWPQDRRLESTPALAPRKPDDKKPDAKKPAPKKPDAKKPDAQPKAPKKP